MKELRAKVMEAEARREREGGELRKKVRRSCGSGGGGLGDGGWGAWVRARGGGSLRGGLSVVGVMVWLGGLLPLLLVFDSSSSLLWPVLDSVSTR